MIGTRLGNRERQLGNRRSYRMRINQAAIGLPAGRIARFIAHCCDKYAVRKRVYHAGGSAPLGRRWRIDYGVKSEVITNIHVHLVLPLITATRRQALGVAAATYIGVVFAVQPFSGDPQFVQRERGAENNAL